MTSQAVILAAGKGSRLQSISLGRSKAMLPVLGKPIVALIMQDLAACGITDFILVTAAGDESIRRYFEVNPLPSVNIRFVRQPIPLGTADALRHAAHLLADRFILAACDNLVPQTHLGELVSTLRSPTSTAAVLSLMQREPSRAANMAFVTLDGSRVTSIIEKPSEREILSSITSLSLYGFSGRILDHLSAVPLSNRGEYEIQDAIQLLIDSGEHVQGIMTHERLSLTNPQDLLAINEHYFSTQGHLQQDYSTQVGDQTHLIPPFLIGSETRIGSRCSIGPRVYIEGKSIIGDDVIIRDAVLLRDSVIPDNTQIENQVIAR
jgi:UDP-N-acetylglucosamine diphosphorylase / glucose-1-phosphate thymidylyltransferase / UDP-N-acetylgalactosamine diphosphorylase / glucosamine-1-phosphate N-acetyltransferase / galactosamine-1-phosphate N-acetyltransferase